MKDTLVRCVTRDLLRRVPHVQDVTTSEVVVGIAYTGVRISTDDVGLANTPLGDLSPENCNIFSRAGTLTDVPAIELGGLAESWDLSERVVGIAALNALSQYAIKTSGSDIIARYGEAIELASIRRNDVVVMVGNMRPSVDKLRRKSKEVLVLERSLGLRDRDVFPDTAAESIIPRGDVVFLTGATLCNGTADRILQLSRNAREVVMLGPSAGVFPPAAFKKGATTVCPIEILDPTRVMRVVAEGGGTSAIMKSAKHVVYRAKHGTKRA